MVAEEFDTNIMIILMRKKFTVINPEPFRILIFIQLSNTSCEATLVEGRR